MTGWTHRIDAVPAIGRRIAFVSDTGLMMGAIGRKGWVVAPCDDFYAGVGDDVRIRPDGGGVWLIPSRTYAWWRYL